MIYSYFSLKEMQVMQVEMSVFIASASVFYGDLLGMIRPIDFMLMHILKCIESLSGTSLFGRFRFIYFLAEEVSVTVTLIHSFGRTDGAINVKVHKQVWQTNTYS